MFTYPVRNSRNPSFWMLMPAPRVQTSETPSSMLRNPSVTISGLIRNAVISRPWTTPTSAPAATAIRIAAYAAAGAEELMLQWLDQDDIEGLRALGQLVAKSYEL